MSKSEIVTSDEEMTLVSTAWRDKAEKALAKQEKYQGGYRKWAQLNMDEIPNLRALNQQYSTACSVLLFMIEKMDRTNAFSCSHSTMAKVLKISESSVRRAIRYLLEQNFIDVIRVPGREALYYINGNLAWKAFGEDQKFAEFKATIVVPREYMDGVKTVHSKTKSVVVKTDEEEEEE